MIISFIKKVGSVVESGAAKRKILGSFQRQFWSWGLCTYWTAGSIIIHFIVVYYFPNRDCRSEANDDFKKFHPSIELTLSRLQCPLLFSFSLEFF